MKSHPTIISLGSINADFQVRAERWAEAGALAVALLEGRSLPAAVRFAVAAANVSVTRYGAQASYPDRGEVDKMLALLPPNEQIA